MTPLLAAALWLCTAHAAAATSDALASSVVASDELRIKRSPDKVEEFIGHVRYRARSNLLQSDWALYDHRAQLWRARGNIFAEHRFTNGDRLRARGENARYDIQSEKGELTNKPGEPVELTRLGEDGQQDFGRARQLEWQGKDRLSLIDDAHFWGPQLEAWSDRADLDPSRRSVKLTGGRPVLRNFDKSWTGAIKADQIDAWQEEGSRRLEASGGVAGWIEFKKKDEALRR